MSYRFDHPERLAFEIRRVATERLENALEQLGGELAHDPAVAVHTARKDIKKTRSLMRLVKDSLGEDRFRAENGRLRDAAHVLAGAREADAKAEALASLIAHAEASASHGDHVPPRVRGTTGWPGKPVWAQTSSIPQPRPPP